MIETRRIADDYFGAIGRGDVEAAVGLLAPGAEFATPAGSVPAPEGVRAMLKGYVDAFPGNRFEVARAFGAGDELAVEGFWIGKHAGTMQLPNGGQIPATGKSVRIPFTTLFRIKAGKIQSHRAYWDMAGFLGQLGLMPA